MYYVEYLRASRSLVIGAIWVAVALVINLALWRAGNVVIDDKHFVVPLTIVWAFAGFVTSIYATVLGGSLAAENEGHLPVAWTKPVSKTKHAATKMAVDLAAVAGMFVLMCIAVFAYFSLTGLSRHITIPADTWLQFVRFFLAPAAFYGLMQAMTATLCRQAGMVLGFAWMGLLALAVLGLSPLPQPYHAIFQFIDYANPLVYLSFNIDKSGTVLSYELTAATMALVLIAVGGITAAIFRWQRVEA